LAQEDIAVNAEFWYDLNKRLSKKWPSITRQKAAPADAEHWATQPNKLSLLEE
jgi:ferredoxin